MIPVRTVYEWPKGGPCVKAQVKATLVAENGHRFVGSNAVENPQTVCPRASAEHFTGYEACKIVCQQVSHAEVSAINLAGELARGGTIYLEGHFAPCPDCQAAADAAGVERIIVGAPPMQEAADGKVQP